MVTAEYIGEEKKTETRKYRTYRNQTEEKSN